MERDFPGRPREQVTGPLARLLATLWQQSGSDPTLTRFALRLGSRKAYASAIARLADPSEPPAVRLAFIAVVGQVGRDDALIELAAAVG